MRELRFTPSPPQLEFLRAKTRYVAYGGARGGGKSWAVRAKATLLALAHPGIRILILRRTFSELRGNHILPLMADLNGVATYRDASKVFIFSCGSRIQLGYLANDADVMQYQGQEYDIIFIDEATQFTEFQFSALTACMRGVNDHPKRMYLTCNPGGVGHAWVKRLFVDRIYSGTERPEDYTFIRAKVYDNVALLDADPGYLSTLSNLPEHLRRAWLDGDWDAMAGQYFDMWRRDIHVIKPFDPPKEWRRYFALDYGRDMLAGYWAAFAPDGCCYVYREVYRPGLLASQAADMVRDASVGENIYAYLAPTDLYNRHADTGKSTAEIFAERGVYFTAASNDRIQGWYNLAEWLAVYEDEQGAPSSRLKICSNCENLIRTLPQLQRDEKRVNDCAREPHELTHAPDALRYLMAGRPCAKMEASPERAREWDYDSFLRYGT